MICYQRANAAWPTNLGRGTTRLRRQAAISDLVGEWRHGVADVAPIHGELTCRNCEYGSFCRERWSLSASDDSLAGAVDSGVEGGGIGGGDGH